jgi:hypothetical protein
LADNQAYYGDHWLFTNIERKATTSHRNSEIVPNLAQENICKQLVTILHPHLICNSLFVCHTHKDKVCKVIIETTFK